MTPSIPSPGCCALTPKYPLLFPSALLPPPTFTCPNGQHCLKPIRLYLICYTSSSTATAVPTRCNSRSTWLLMLLLMLLLPLLPAVSPAVPDCCYCRYCHPGQVSRTLRCGGAVPGGMGGERPGLQLPPQPQGAGVASGRAGGTPGLTCTPCEGPGAGHVGGLSVGYGAVHLGREVGAWLSCS